MWLGLVISRLLQGNGKEVGTIKCKEHELFSLCLTFHELGDHKVPSLTTSCTYVSASFSYEFKANRVPTSVLSCGCLTLNSAVRPLLFLTTSGREAFLETISKSAPIAGGITLRSQAINDDVLNQR
jgi:hypothetical protein